MTKRPDIEGWLNGDGLPKKKVDAVTLARYALELEAERDRLSGVIKLMVEADKNLMANFRSLEKRLETADALLGEVEYFDDTEYGDMCPVCYWAKNNEHSPSCKLNAYIQEGKQ